MHRNRRFASSVAVTVILAALASTIGTARQQAAATATAPEVQSSSVPAAASPSPTQGTTEKSGPASQDSSKIICRQTAPIGTRIAKKTCKTAAAWDELRRMGSEAARDGAEQGRICADNCAAPGG